MVSTTSHHPFNRSGVAPLSDLSTPEWRSLFALLEKEQAGFLEQEAQFRSAAYKWPRDPLHWWSRAWEYPYVYFHLKRHRELWEAGHAPRLVDLGSGVTFFPFVVARLGYRVTCADIDLVCSRDLSKAKSVMSARPGEVDFRLVEGARLPFDDGVLDGLYCVSVLEHIPNCSETVAEVARVIKPGGLLILTFDLDLRGDQAIGTEGYHLLRRALQQHFDYRHSETSIHPANVLNSWNSPFGLQRPSLGRRVYHGLKMTTRELLFRRRPYPLVPFELAIEGAVLVRRS
jgi:SAM-dependent methyltransferase